MKHRQTGLTLIELMVALALTAVLGIMLAALVNGWLKVRERLQDTTRQISVLDFCLALERRFDSPVLRRVYDQRLPLASRWLDWQPASNQLLWVASTGLLGSRRWLAPATPAPAVRGPRATPAAGKLGGPVRRWRPALGTARTTRPGQRHERSVLPGRPLAGLAF